nr:hypothetical protein CFP56_44304 [Quercus suber]
MRRGLFRENEMTDTSCAGVVLYGFHYGRYVPITFSQTCCWVLTSHSPDSERTWHDRKAVGRDIGLYLPLPLPGFMKPAIGSMLYPYFDTCLCCAVHTVLYCISIETSHVSWDAGGKYLPRDGDVFRDTIDARRRDSMGAFWRERASCCGSVSERTQSRHLSVLYVGGTVYLGGAVPVHFGASARLGGNPSLGRAGIEDKVGRCMRRNVVSGDAARHKRAFDFIAEGGFAQFFLALSRVLHVAFPADLTDEPSATGISGYSRAAYVMNQPACSPYRPDTCLRSGCRTVEAPKTYHAATASLILKPPIVLIALRHAAHARSSLRNRVQLRLNEDNVCCSSKQSTAR